MTYRRHSVVFKRQIVEEWMSGVSLGQLSRRYQLSSALIQAWKKKYTEGQLVEGPSADDQALRVRVAELERMVGRLTMENDLLKKAAEFIRQQRNASSRVITAKDLAASNGRVKP